MSNTRTLVKTTTAGWFIDTADPDGKRVRKQDGDEVISLEEFEARKSGESKAEKPQRDKDAPPVVTAETGKSLVGKTTVIKCNYKDPETGKVCGKERTIKVQDQFQVKKCVEHQKRHRLDLRKKARAAKAKKKAVAA